jgi:Rrf2 family protein
VTLITRPPSRRSIILSTAACVTRKTPRRLTHDPQADARAAAGDDRDPAREVDQLVQRRGRRSGAGVHRRSFLARGRAGQRPPGRIQAMRISAKADYAVRAAVELAAAGEGPTKGDAIARAQQIPVKFLENILADLRHAGLVRSQRGVDGGYWLARPAADITIADIIRAVEGPLATVRGRRPEEIRYDGSSGPLVEVWIAVRASLRDIVEHVTVADVAEGRLPERITRLTSEPDAWAAR